MAVTTSDTAFEIALFFAPPTAPIDSSSPYAAGASVPPKQRAASVRSETRT